MNASDESAVFKTEYRRSLYHKRIFILVCLAISCVAFILALSVGLASIGFWESYDTFIRHLTGNVVDTHVDFIVWDLRVPEAAMAVIAGATLAVGGAIMQTSLRNPLADPYTMGVSSGALFGAAIAIIYSVSIIPGLTEQNAIIGNAFVLSLVPTIAITIVSMKHTVTPAKLLLVGIAVMYVFSSITSLLMITSEAETLQEVYTWNVGTLAGVTFEQLRMPFAFFVIGFVFLMMQYRNFNILIAGPTNAKTMGVNAKFTIVAGMVVVSLMTASVVSVTGTLGFIGLVAPNVARFFVGSETKYLLPSSAAFGAMFLLIANSAARVCTQFGLPVGVICSIVGGPLFIAIIIIQRKKAWL